MECTNYIYSIIIMYEVFFMHALLKREEKKKKCQATQNCWDRALVAFKLQIHATKLNITYECDMHCSPALRGERELYACKIHFRFYVFCCAFLSWLRCQCLPFKPIQTAFNLIFGVVHIFFLLSSVLTFMWNQTEFCWFFYTIKIKLLKVTCIWHSFTCCFLW